MPKKEAKKSSGEPARDESSKDFREQYLRLAADFDNYRKRVENEKLAMRQQAKIEILEKLLPLLDNFSRAIGCAPEEEWARGVCQLFGSFEQQLTELGLRRIATVGEKFDARRHEALMSAEDQKNKDTILEELQPGWEMDGTVIRPAKVKVAV